MERFEALDFKDANVVVRGSRVAHLAAWSRLNRAGRAAQWLLDQCRSEG
jgi:hypothetical protein